MRASRGQRDEALEEVRITNLRAIDDLRIPFDYPVSVLAGPNGSGKSTVLFACACAYRVPGRRSGHFAPGRLFPNFTSRQERRQKRGEEQRDPRISARPEGPNYPLAALLTQTHRSLTDGRLRPPEFRPIRTAHFPSGLHIDSCNMSPEQGIPSNNASRLAT